MTTSLYDSLLSFINNNNNQIGRVVSHVKVVKGSKKIIIKNIITKMHSRSFLSFNLLYSIYKIGTPSNVNRKNKRLRN